MAGDTGLLAVITTAPYKEPLVTGATPIFLARDDAEAQAIAGALAQILDGMMHSLPNGVVLIVKH